MDPSLIESARAAVVNRMHAIEAALVDLDDPVFKLIDSDVFHANTTWERRYYNRVLIAAINISHLGDDVKRLTRRLAVPNGQLEAAMQASVPIRIAIRLGDTAKHGLGGRSKNATILNGLFEVRQSPIGREPVDNKILIAGAVVADAEFGVLQSSTLFRYAVRDWAAILVQLNIEVADWISRVAPDEENVVVVQPGTHPDVALGTTVHPELPPHLTEALRSDVKSRSESA